MIAASRASGARQKELAGASHLHLDRKAKRLTVVGKRNKLRVIDLDPFGGAAIFDSLSEGIANAPLFWHGNGRALRQCIEPVRPLHQPTCGKGTLISFGSGSISLRHLHALEWLRSGRSIHISQHRLGHDSIKTTEV
jgi:integrase/recombinase XerD